MTELSYPWGGVSGGDASVAPYTAETWSLIWSAMFNHQRTMDGVIPTDSAPFNQLLRVFVSAGVEVYMDEGKALVDGTFYSNNATVLVGIPGPGYYSVVLHKDKAAHTVRAQLRPFGVTQNDDVWEISLADVTNVAGTVTAIDRRRFINTFPKIYKRQGGSASEWGTTGGVTNYTAFNSMMMTGSASGIIPAGSRYDTKTYGFLRPFTFTPIVIVNGRQPFSLPGGPVNHFEALPTAEDVTFMIKRSSTIDGEMPYIFSWIAIGPG